MFGWILGRVNIKLEGWKEQLISKAGKEILLKTVVQALPQYAISIFKIHVPICKAIEKKDCKFLVEERRIQSWPSLEKMGSFENEEG